MKINSLEIENVKKIKAIKIEPTANGLTVIGGKNGQGKTSILDSIAWALGGEKFRPSNVQREGSLSSPLLKITTDNGLLIERKGKNSTLVVTDASGKKSGQQLLNEFITTFALDVPKFIESSNKEKASILLNIIGVEDELIKLEQRQTELYSKRHAIGQIAERKQKYADELEEYYNVPEQPISAAELIQQQQDILRQNAENDRIRLHKSELEREFASLSSEIERIETDLKNKKTNLEKLRKSLEISKQEVSELVDRNTDELERNIKDIERINIQVRANLEKEHASEEADEYKRQYRELSAEIESVINMKIKLLNSAELPLKGLSVMDGELVYEGHKWDCISSSEQLKIATSIVRKLNPECEFVLLDKLEQMDVETLDEFGKWAEEEKLQIIATRVSTGDECSIVIEDGSVVAENATTAKQWKAGEF